MRGSHGGGINHILSVFNFKFYCLNDQDRGLAYGQSRSSATRMKPSFLASASMAI
jgi:hypothetical protein